MKRFRFFVLLAFLASVAGVALAGWVPWRNRARINVVNESGERAALVVVVQEIDKNDSSSEPVVLAEALRRLNLGATNNGAKKSFTIVRKGGLRRFIARPFWRLAGGALGAPAADYQEFYTGDARAEITFTIPAPVVVPPPTGQYPAGLTVVDSIAGTSYSTEYTTMTADAANVVVPANDPRHVEVQWNMTPVVVAPSFGTIIPGYFDASLTWVGDVEGWYSVRVPLSTGGTVNFTGQHYVRGQATVMTITAATKSADGGSFLRRQPRVPTAGSWGSPISPN